MHECMAAYEVYKDSGYNVSALFKYKTIQVDLIYDVKHDGRHKARLVANGHLTKTPDDSVYSNVVSL